MNMSFRDKLNCLFSSSKIKYRHKAGESLVGIPSVSRIQYRKVDSIRLVQKAEFLKDVIKKLDGYISRLPSDQDLLKDPDVGYCFPSDFTINEYIHDRAGGPVDASAVKAEMYRYVNRDPDSMNSWLRDFVEELKEKNKSGVNDYRFITGKKGLGKTTFVTFLMRSQKNFLLKNKVVFSILDYSDYKEVFSQSDKDIDWNGLTGGKIETSLVKSIMNLENELHLFDLSSSSCFQEYDSFLDAHPLFRKTDDLLRKYEAMCVSIKRDLTFKNVHKFIDPAVKEFLLFHVAKNWNFVVLIDGLDQISYDKLSDEKFGKMFHSLSEWVIMDTKFGCYEDVTCNYIVSLRDCTYNPFSYKKRPKNHSPSKHFKISPAGSEAVLVRGIRYYVRSRGEKNFWKDKEAPLVRFVKKFYRLICDSLHVRGDLAKHFNYDYREMLKYFYNCFAFVSEHVVNKNPGCFLQKERRKNRKINQEDLETFLTCLFHEDMLVELRKNWYHFVEILLLAQNESFRNHFSPAGKGLSKYPDDSRGHIDNIFNYHLSYSDFHKLRLPPLLVKVRILQITKNYISLDNLQIQLSGFGYKINNLEQTLKMLQGARMLKTSSRDNSRDLIQYSRTANSNYLLEHLAFLMPYLENVLLQTLLPRTLAPFFIPASHQHKSHWVSACLVNTYIFFKLIEWIESIEEENLKRNNSIIQDWKITPYIKHNLQTSFRAIIENDLNTPHRYRMLDLDSIFLSIEKFLTSCNAQRR